MNETRQLVMPPKDLFGGPVKEGDKIVYIVNNHGYTVLNWAVVDNIYYPKSVHAHVVRPRYRVSKYAEKGGWDSDIDRFPKSVILSSPTILVVGRSIEDII